MLFKREVENDASLTSQALNILSDFKELNRLRLKAVGNAPNLDCTLSTLMELFPPRLLGCKYGYQRSLRPFMCG